MQEEEILDSTEIKKNSKNNSTIKAILNILFVLVFVVVCIGLIMGYFKVPKANLFLILGVVLGGIWFILNLLYRK